jgi:hypothetical protein
VPARAAEKTPKTNAATISPAIVEARKYFTRLISFKNGLLRCSLF